MIPRFTALSSGALLAVLLAVGGAGPLPAQTLEGQPQPKPQAPGSQSAQYSQDELESFVAATVAVQELSQKWEPQIQGAPDEQTALDLRNQANAEMTAAVEAQGLTADKFREIYLAALSDPVLNDRLEQIYRRSSQ